MEVEISREIFEQYSQAQTWDNILKTDEGANLDKEVEDVLKDLWKLSWDQILEDFKDCDEAFINSLKEIWELRDQPELSTNSPLAVIFASHFKTQIQRPSSD